MFLFNRLQTDNYTLRVINWVGENINNIVLHNNSSTSTMAPPTRITLKEVMNENNQYFSDWIKDPSHVYIGPQR